MNHLFNWERELAKYYTIREVKTRNTELPPRSIVCEACHKECKPIAVLYIYGNECMNQPNIRLTARTVIETEWTGKNHKKKCNPKSTSSTARKN